MSLGGDCSTSTPALLAWPGVHPPYRSLSMSGLDFCNITIVTQRRFPYSVSPVCLRPFFLPFSPTSWCRHSTHPSQLHGFLRFDKLAFMPSPRAAITLLKGTDHLERRISGPEALLPGWQQPIYQHLWEPLFILHVCAIAEILLFLCLQEGASACPQLRWNSIARELPREIATSECESTATGSSSWCCSWWKTVRNSLGDQGSAKIDHGKPTYCNDLHTFKKMML